MNSRPIKPHLYSSLCLGVILLLSLPITGRSAELNGRLSSELYNFSADGDKHLRPYQRLSSDLLAYRSESGQAISWHSSLRWTSDLNRKQLGDPELFIRQSYFKFTGLPLKSVIKFGRQFAYDGLSSGLIDGLSLATKLSQALELSLFTGSSVDWQDPETIRSYADWLTIGGRLNYKFNRQTRLVGLWHLEKSNGLISQAQLGLSGQYRAETFTGYSRIIYDPISQRFATLFARIRLPFENWKLTLEGGTRTPQIRLNSIFSIIKTERQKEIRLNVSRKLSTAWRATGSIKASLNRNNSSTRVALGFRSSRYHLIWTNQSGDDGKNNGLQAGTNLSIGTSLRIYATGGYNSYMVQEMAESEIVAWYLRLGLFRRINKTLEVSGEMQFLGNAVVEKETRLFFRLSKAFSLGGDHE